MERPRQVHLEGNLTLHSICKELVDFPPEGYTFTVDSSTFVRTVQKAKKFQPLTQFQALLEMWAGVPAALLKAQMGYLRKPRRDTVLTYAYLHPVYRKEPWVMDLEVVHTLVSNNPLIFRRYKGNLERLFASPFCRKIMPWSEAGRKMLTDNLDCRFFDEKIQVVPLAVRPKHFVKRYAESNERVKILFVGSAYSAGWFKLKGGMEALEAFLRLNKLYQGLEMVIRSDVPTVVKRLCAGVSNIRILEGVLPWSELEREYQTADIFMLPAHNTPFMVLLEAMSYELPIITTDVFATPELIEDGRTGLLVSRSRRLTYFNEGLPNWGTRQFMRGMTVLDPNVVEALADRAKVLIENPQLRMRLGKAARQEVEQGRFSIERRNKTLRRIFDEALSL